MTKESDRRKHGHWQLVALNLGTYTMILVMLTLGTATFWPYQPITSMELTVIGTPRPDSPMMVKVDYCKTVNSSPWDVRWFLINEVTVILPSSMMTLPKGCGTRLISIDLPRHVAPARYKLMVEDIYQPLPWRQVTKTAISNSFSVDPQQQ